MQTIFLVFLFLLNMIAFYIIALLYVKVSKFNNLEMKQQKLMEEMDNAIGAYLTEMKDENERLIKIIEERQQKDDVYHAGSQGDTMKESNTDKIVAQAESDFVLKSPKIPVKMALKSYQSMPISAKKTETDKAVEDPVQETAAEPIEMDDRSLAFSMQQQGMSVEEIAKQLGKGKTYVELLLKFR
ncbi:hypothetical protein [Sporosarcina sp. USHLN248]|uniref:hypothetical protein n=1 Tax=Sporosarcina sp. USHLN248 TaxID=3081300 RepID=UPI00301A515C